MKTSKFFGALALAATLACVIGVFVSPPHKQAQAAILPIPPAVVAWDSLGVAAGVSITSPVFTLNNCDDLEAVADNSLGGATRALTLSWLGSDGATILYQRSVTVAIGGRVAVNVSRIASAAATGGETVIPVAPGYRMQMALAAGGAAAGSLAVYCR